MAPVNIIHQGRRIGRAIPTTCAGSSLTCLFAGRRLVATIPGYCSLPNLRRRILREFASAEYKNERAF
jgi:hypothetical protein